MTEPIFFVLVAAKIAIMNYKLGLVNSLWKEAAPNRQQIKDGQIIDREIVEPAYDVRPDRNAMLASTDWTQLPDSPLSDEKKQLWKQYRQALRDMPAASDTIWPERPE